MYQGQTVHFYILAQGASGFEKLLRPPQKVAKVLAQTLRGNPLILRKMSPNKKSTTDWHKWHMTSHSYLCTFFYYSTAKSGALSALNFVRIQHQRMVRNAVLKNPKAM